MRAKTCLFFSSFYDDPGTITPSIFFLPIFDVDGVNTGFDVEKLSDSNHHVWKPKIKFVLSFRKLNSYFKNHLLPSNNENLFL